MRLAEDAHHFIRKLEEFLRYMRDEIIPERIHNYYPKAKIICLLCEPSHRTLSHYLHIRALSKVYYETPGMKRYYHRNITDELGTYNNAITTGINAILESNPKIVEEINDTKNKFKNYAELRETIYTYVNHTIITPIPDP